jgi:hypothetical protein
MTWLLRLGLLLLLSSAAATGLTALGARRWAGRMAALARGLEAARRDAAGGPPTSAQGPTHYDAREIEGLPAPVQRYFRTVLKDGQAIVSAVTIEMAGTINMSATAEQWKPFTSKQRVVTSTAGLRPGFMWDARISMLPGMKVHVLDAYIAGQGMLRAAMLGLFTVADMRGGGEMARGEFMRFFAETPWYPTALLPSQGVQWTAVDDTSANASISDGPVTLTLLFHFNDAGLIDSVRAEARGGMVGKQIVMRPWECGLSDYRPQDGMLIPMAGEAAWIGPEGRKSYFHGSVKTMAYEWSPQGRP